LFQILYRFLKYLFFSFMKVRIVKFIQWGPCSINSPKFPKIWFFETFYITIRHLVLVTFIHFIHNKVFVVKILGQKKWFRHSLWMFELFFSHETKYWIFFKNLVGIFKPVQIWHFTHRILHF
jgi:hypothetical protein